MTVIVRDIVAHPNDASATQGGPMNTEWNSTNLHFGTHKSGLPQQPSLRFDDLDIPPGSVINAASILNESWTVTSGTGNFNAEVKLLLPDGYWDATSKAAQWTASVSDDDWHVELLDVVTQLVITGAAASAREFGPILEGDNGIRVQRAAQGVDIAVAGDITIARVSLGGSFAAGTGDVWVEIWSDVAGLPGVLLGTSATRLIADILPKIWAEVRPTYDFTFTGPDIVTVAINDLVHVVMRTDVVGGTGVHLGSWRYAYAGGNLAPYGESPEGGFDSQNYLTLDDEWAIPTLGAPVAWVVPLTVAFQTTPSLVSLIQSWLGPGGYANRHLIGFRYDRVTSNGGIIYGGFPGTTAAVCRLTIDFTPPASTRRRDRLTT